MKYKIMSHFIAGYPDYTASLEIARALIDGGTAYLEIQFPFSDGTADGPLIQGACSSALKRGFSVSGGFELVAKICKTTDIPVYIMTYANIVYVNGIENFLDQVQSAGGRGVIIPDLPPDSDEELYSQGNSKGLHVIPVVAPSISLERLQIMFAKNVEYIYASLRKGITGKTTEIGTENLNFLKRVAGGGMKVLAGFGISSQEQVRLLEGHVEAVVVGSEFLRIVNQAVSEGGQLYAPLCAKMKALSGH